jgi:hypothetical protein
MLGVLQVLVAGRIGRPVDRVENQAVFPISMLAALISVGNVLPDRKWWMM